MSDKEFEDLKQQIRAAEEAQNRRIPDPQINLVPPQYQLSVKLLILKEYVLHILAGGFIGYVLDMIFSVFASKLIFPLCTSILIATCLLVATYRSYRILKGKDPDG